jgi:hypothetical protein
VFSFGQYACQQTADVYQQTCQIVENPTISSTFHYLELIILLNEKFFVGLSLDAWFHTNLCDLAASETETQSAEATVLFHILQSARFAHASIRNFLKFMKNVANAPELVLDPFLLTILLSLSNISIYQEQVGSYFFKLHGMTL